MALVAAAVSLLAPKGRPEHDLVIETAERDSEVYAS
jgi:hypothetical protein